MAQPSLIVHGGAGDFDHVPHNACIEGVRRAAQIGWELLIAGRSALDVVEQVARVLEDDPLSDAGRGSHLNAEGKIELDALIMDGQTLRNGAVAGIQGIANPISLARLVMERTTHALLVGEGAQAFATRMGIPRVPEEELLVDREIDLWRAHKAGLASTDKGHDTVGVIALDSNGNIAVATSTGGTPYKLAGRVGDSPLIGCGAYADNDLGGAGATGVGEDMMKVVLSKAVCDLMGTGMSAQVAAEQSVRRLSDPRINGSGGVIALDMNGGVGVAHSTPYLARAYVTSSGEIIATMR